MREWTAQASRPRVDLAASDDESSRGRSWLDVSDSRRTQVLEDVFDKGGLGNGGIGRSRTSVCFAAPARPCHWPLSHVRVLRGTGTSVCIATGLSAGRRESFGGPLSPGWP